MIGCTKVVSVSTSCSKYSILTSSSCTMTQLPYGLQPVFLCLSHIYSIDTILYPYALPLIHLPILIFSLCLRCNLSSMSKGHNKVYHKLPVRVEDDKINNFLFFFLIFILFLILFYIWT